MKIAILGGGLAGISAAYFLQSKSDVENIHVYEARSEIGGLCRSYEHDGIYYDVGPHIFFSKDKDTLDFMLNIMGENKNRLRRSNRIIHKKSFVQYPFENDLSKLPKKDRDFCLHSFLNNPYRDYSADNMLQFFLKIFGEGITDLYLRPYNEKIWKFDPCFMDTQMVERIPRPPDEDIIRSANGETVDGYLHQLYFYYPKRGGTFAFIKAFADMLSDKVKICLNEKVLSAGDGVVRTVKGEYKVDKIISCIPPQEFADGEIRSVADDLKYNDIIIAVATVNIDKAGDNFAFMIADKNIIFHRISKLDFLGKNYHAASGATYMMECTYRKGDRYSRMSDEELKTAFAEGLKSIGFIDNVQNITAFSLKRFPYAYVIYDLNHKANMEITRKHFAKKGVFLNGRFGNFEYWNMDKVIAESRKLVEQIFKE